MSLCARCLLIAALLAIATPPARAQARTYAVDCRADAAGGVLHSLDEVNELTLSAKDKLLFERGTVCRGSLHPKGSGFVIDAKGTGPLPVIEAGPRDEAALRLFNQEEISISSLELRGGTTYGVTISGDHGTMHSISLNNLTVSNVRGPLQHKESGLVVIKPASPDATFDGVHLDGIRAFDTTQWSGIFIAGGSREHPAQSVTVTHSVVHDVQGDGIVIFNAANSSIRRSVAWHTGMQHQQSIGTPNAIWTWQCDRCDVEENEAFLTDSPGVDGGAFDIDWGNTMNTVARNFGHETQGYCVSVFGANGPTRQSAILDNLCLNNGLSPRLAQRQGAILLMTWGGGSIEGLEIARNRIDWKPDGDTPAIRTGSIVQASGVSFHDNEIHTTGTRPVDSTLLYSGSRNRYFLQGATVGDLAIAKKSLTREDKPVVAKESPATALQPAITRTSGWRLIAVAPSHAGAAPHDLEGLLINLKTAALEYGHGGLKVSLSGDANVLLSARDWGLPAGGVALTAVDDAREAFSLKLVSPAGKVVQTWTAAAAPIELGMALRRSIGAPAYGRLKFEQVRATD
ncbi:MAG TPA: right-handed parallel beta-helix repeat-containing protein [Acidobacteriaceae bacterium]|nr:right-handed parallel beta-helix repeat-containing protein [Acidobacteriaceae bacterium]